MIQRNTFSGTFAADAYRSLADLFAISVGGSAQGVSIIGGVLQAQTNGVTLRVVPRGSPAPATADPGTTLAVGAAIGLQATDAWRLDEIWCRNTVAGSNATVVFSGSVEV